MKGLILVDLQNDFVERGALAVPGGRDLIPLINALQNRFDHIVGTQDWHPPDHGSFFINHPGARVYEKIDLNGVPQTLWPVHCVQDSPGADFVPGLDRSRWLRTFHKGTDRGVDSYSTFFDNARRRSTGLEEYLRERGIREVFVAGLATEYCVKYSVLDARSLGFEVTMIEDACRGIDLIPGDVSTSIREMCDAGARMIRSAELLQGERLL